MAVRVVVADDNYLVRQGVAGLIDADPELEMADEGRVTLNKVVKGGEGQVSLRV